MDVGFSLFFPLTNDLFVSVIVGQLVVIVLIGCAAPFCELVSMSTPMVHR